MMDKDATQNTSTQTQANSVNSKDTVENEESSVTVGALLKNFRLQSGQEVEHIASALKVSSAQIHALEADDFGEESSLYFVRALAARVCRHLNQDPAAVLAKMPGNNVRSAAATESTIKRSSMSPTPIANRSRMPLWFSIILVVFLLAATIIYTLPWIQQKFKNSQAKTAPETVSASISKTATILEKKKNITQKDEPEPAVMVAQEAVLELSASGKTWIKITTPENKSIYEGWLNKGQSHKLTVAQYPLSVTIGKAKNTTVLHNGETLDLKPHTKQGVARFELKKP